MRLFSIKRLIISAVLGFLLPLSYMIILSLVGDYTGKLVPEFMVIPFGWPRPIWIFLIGRQPSDADLLTGLLFMALCNIGLYGAVSYVALTMLPLLKRKHVDYEAPPPPEQMYS